MRRRPTHSMRHAVTYPSWVRLGTFLKRQNPFTKEDEGKLERRYLAGPGKPEQTVVAPLPGIDVTTDQKVKKLVSMWAGGHKIKYIDRVPHVMMHSLTPPQGRRKVEKEKKFIECDQKDEVDIIKSAICSVSNVFYAGS